MTSPAQQPQTAPASYAADEHIAAAGRFVWYELTTTDVAAAVEYYHALFGWTTRRTDMGAAGTYTIITAPTGADVGGIVSLDAGQSTHSRWLSYVTVDDVDAACARAAAAGGQVRFPPTDIPDVGRFAVVADPAGAFLAPFKPLGPAGAERTGPAAAGTFCWNELLTPEPERAVEFYTATLGWSTRELDMGPAGTYWIFQRGGKDEAGMLRMPPDAAAPPFWLPYVAVASVDASTARVAELGGGVHVRPTDIPQVGRFSVTQDPTGASLALFEAPAA